jgi:hypothetical protein
MSEVLRIARSRDEFFQLVQEALNENDPEAGRRRQAAVAAGTWDARAEWVGGLIQQVLDAKSR